MAATTTGPDWYPLPALRGAVAIAIAPARALADREARLGLGEEQLRLLLGARIERWLPFVEQLVAEGGGFLAIGAGHLPGADGLVALLRARLPGHARPGRSLRNAPTRRRPSRIRSIPLAYENRRYPSAASPKSIPGVTATWAPARISKAKS
jgi:TraB/PrgY/gumN family